MNISCKKAEWNFLESFLMNSFSIKTTFSYHNFFCKIYDEDELVLEINGIFTD